MIGKRAVPFLLLAGILAGCVSHLREAKVHFSQAQGLSRAYKTEAAIASYKRTLLEADRAARRNPSAQAFMMRGLAEVALERWSDAAESFRMASAFGFESGEAWASDVSLLGLAISFEEMGLADSALAAYAHVLGKSGFRSVLMTAAQRHTDLVLSRVLAVDGKGRERLLSGQIKVIDKLLAGDFGCGFYHYLHSQVLSHQMVFRRSYEEAVMARELGLPSEKILRDNDNQILFCCDRLRESLRPEDWSVFSTRHEAWARKWSWKDARTPGWKGN